MPAEADAVTVDDDVLDGPPVEVLAAAHVPWLDPDDGPGTWTAGADGLRMVPPADGATATMFPGGSLRLRLDARAAAQAADDGPLFRDGRSRGLPWVTVQTGPRTDWRLTLRPELVGDRRDARAGLLAPDRRRGHPRDARIPPRVGSWPGSAPRCRGSPTTPSCTTCRRAGWSSTPAAPGAPATSARARSACCSPSARTRSCASCSLLIMGAQNARGDWPQAFDFLDRHRQPGQQGAHGDVVFWPLLALGEYLAATGDRLSIAGP